MDRNLNEKRIQSKAKLKLSIRFLRIVKIVIMNYFIKFFIYKLSK